MTFRPFARRAGRAPGIGQSDAQPASPSSSRRRWLASVCGGLALALSWAPAQASTELPATVRAELARAQLPPEALVVWVAEVGARPAAPRLAHRTDVPVNPASLMKLYSTGAALELLGPAWTWTTPVLATGPIEGGVLHGDLLIQGRGDPTLLVERLWLLLRQLQQRGVRDVRGDIVLDRSAFRLTPRDPGAFDGERYRPYNVQPDALMLNLKSLTLSFVPDPAAGVARIGVDVPLAGVRVDTSVPLAEGPCGDWRSALQADFADPARLRFAGRYQAACGERNWPVAYADPASYNARLIAGLWAELGGRLGGTVREATGPSGRATLLFEFASPPLATVVRDINKFSNNVMAEQVFLTLGTQVAPTQGEACCTSNGPGGAQADTAAQARAVLRAHVRERTGCREPEMWIDNGSGLSRDSLSSARCLGTWLQALWGGTTMSELASSLPVGGVDGTARRIGRGWGAAANRTHLKTGSLRDVHGLAGYVLGSSGRRYAFVAMLNHPNAGGGRPVLDALVQWVAEDATP